jgi:hypothetical protein
MSEQPPLPPPHPLPSPLPSDLKPTATHPLQLQRPPSAGRPFGTLLDQGRGGGGRGGAFSGDLAPGGGGFGGPLPGGNLMGPQHFRPALDPRAGVPGTVPGARFDPYGPTIPGGPFGSRPGAGGSRSSGEPNPDALPPPGFGNQYDDAPH